MEIGKCASGSARAVSWLMAMPVLVMLLAGCDGHDGSGSSKETTEPQLPPSGEPHWVNQADPRNRVAVVFVHGLFGTTDGTWNNADGSGFFKFLHENPDVGGKVDIFAFGFTSKMLTGGSLDIREAANKLEQTLTFYRVWDYENVVFVAHSMGGLISLREIAAHPERREKVPLVVLYSTPMFGSDIANIGKLVANNKAVAQLSPADGNALLQQDIDDWKLIAAEQRPRVVCAYETAATDGIMVVKWTSAVPLCDGAPTAIGGANHIDIVKPQSPTGDAMIVLFNALQEYVLGQKGNGFLEAPDFSEENGEWVFNLTNPNGETPATLVNDGKQGLRYVVSHISDPDLLVLPDPTPRIIPGNGQERLRIYLTRDAALDKEYGFTLGTPVLGDRVVKVRIPDRQAIETARAEVANAVAGGMADYLESGGNLSAFQSASNEERAEIAARLARESVAAKLPDAPAQAQWLIAADTLASAGLPDFAEKALNNAKFDPARTANAGAVGRLNEAIRYRKVQNVVPPQADVPPPATPEAPAANPVNAQNAQQWAVVSEKIQTVPDLKADALALKGDVLHSQGQEQAALATYQQAVQLKPSPALKAKAAGTVATRP